VGVAYSVTTSLKFKLDLYHPANYDREMKAPLTRRQRLVLDFIRECLDREGVAPTLGEISEHFGFSSTASAQKHVRALVEKAYLLKEKHRSRGLLIPDEDGVPLLGAVAAGSPIENFGEEERIKIPSYMVGKGEHFALRVRGLSMIDEGIHDGDLIIVRKTTTVRDGDLVVALIDGEATVKRLYRKTGNMLLLQPSNATMTAQLLPADRVCIQGVVSGLMRQY